MVTLGLDASTTCVGYAFTKNKRILDMGFIDIKKEKTPKEKVEKVIEYLNKTSHIDDVYDINVEDNLSGFAGGRTSQQVIIKLAKDTNFTIQLNSTNTITTHEYSVTLLPS